MSSERTRRHEVWNELADADALWGPLTFLRPAHDQEFSHARLLFINIVFGSFYGMCGNILLIWVHHLTHYRVFPLPVLPLALVATSFLCGELTFLPAWNSRARRTVRRSTWLAAKARVAPSPGNGPNGREPFASD